MQSCSVRAGVQVSTVRYTLGELLNFSLSCHAVKSCRALRKWIRLLLIIQTTHRDLSRR